MFLSTNANRLVDLWHVDDGSGNQQWTLEPKPTGNFQILTNSSSPYRFLSTNGHRLIDLWSVDDNSGRQRWTLVPEDVQMIDLQFDLAIAIIEQQPDFIVTQTLINNTNVSQSQVTSFQKSASSTSSFEHTHGFSVSVKATKNFGVPAFTSGSVEIGLETHSEWTIGQTTTTQDTRTYDFNVVVPPNTRICARASVTQAKLDVPYTATLLSPSTEQEVEVQGIWRGVSVGNITQQFDEC